MRTQMGRWLGCRLSEECTSVSEENRVLACQGTSRDSQLLVVACQGLSICNRVGSGVGLAIGSLWDTPFPGRSLPGMACPCPSQTSPAGKFDASLVHIEWRASLDMLLSGVVGCVLKLRRQGPAKPLHAEKLPTDAGAGQQACTHETTHTKSTSHPVALRHPLLSPSTHG